MISSVYRNTYCTETKQGKRKRKNETQKVARAFSRELTDRATPAEKVFAKLLGELGIKFEFQRPFSRGKTFAIVDFWLPDYGLIIEIDGGYHNDIEQAKRDAARSEDLLRKGKVNKVVRFTNEQATGDPSSIIKTMAAQVVPWAAHLLK